MSILSGLPDITEFRAGTPTPTGTSTGTSTATLTATGAAHGVDGENSLIATGGDGKKGRNMPMMARASAMAVTQGKNSVSTIPCHQAALRSFHLVCWRATLGPHTLDLQEKIK
jgi:hypothetical protein